MKFQLRLVGVKLRAALTSAICDEGLSVMQPSSAPDPSVIVEVDLPHIFEFIENCHVAWMLPLQIILSLTALVYILDAYSISAGLLASLVLLPILQYTMGLIQTSMFRIMQAKDIRVELVAQVLRQAKQLKLAWLQALYGDKVAAARETELILTAKMANLNAAAVFFTSLIPTTLMLSSLALFVHRGGSLTSQVLFPALAFFFNITRAYAVVTQIVMRYQGCLTGLKRIRDIILTSDQESHANGDEDNEEANETINCQSCTVDQPSVAFKSCVLYAPGVACTMLDKPLLTNCTFRARSGDLVIITGPVGSGKSTIIKHLVGSLKPSAGYIDVQGTTSYASQQPFIINGTVRDNILFGLPLDIHFHNRVIKAVCLQDDLLRLPNGDATVLKGLGVALSGGQKSRVGLARAIYARRQIVILDDPLAAVDPRVARSLISNVLGPYGILRDSIKIVTSNFEQLFQHADHIFAINKGVVEETTASDVTMRIPSEALHRCLPEQPTINIVESPAVISGYGTSSTVKQPSVVVEPSRNEATEETPLILEAHRPSGVTDQIKSVKIRQYIQFMMLARRGGWPVVILLAACAKFLDVVAVYFLKLATAEVETSGTYPAGRIASFAACSFVSALISGIFIIAAYHLCLIPVSRAIHAQLTQGLLATHLRYFDTTPMGELLNYFTNDMQKLDNSVNSAMLILVGIVVTCSSSIIVILATSLMSLFYLMPVGAIYYSVQSYYLNACRQLRFLENAARGPVLNSIAEMYTGTAVILAFGQAHTFRHQARRAIDEHTRVWLPFLVLDTWLLIRLQLLASIVQLMSAGLLISVAASSSSLGLVMNFVIQMTSQFNTLVQTRATLEAEFTSVIRIWNSARLESENKDSEDKGNSVAAGWPRSPSIQFESFTMSYDPQSPLCLQNVSFAVKPGEHVAVVGRTGAGKSSIAMALLRGVGAGSVSAGRIVIDGVDISQLSLARLRRSITLMSQDPLIMTGTLRNNLDPKGVKTSAQLIEAVEGCQIHRLLGTDSSLDVLDYQIASSGSNLSLGQVQTIALARALLSRNSIIILDEGTWKHVQSNSLFRDCTLLSITHDISSAMAYDRVLVLQAGKIAEFDTPTALISDPKTIFSQLAAEAKHT
ncbi:P-loop containing nucleoside triphosphate hydrolase protein [Fusarium avenaceum]|nr:P-loop containing nucleoside triphosphate hydrolase protein [Fusarium avenaceum]